MHVRQNLHIFLVCIQAKIHADSVSVTRTKNGSSELGDVVCGTFQKIKSYFRRSTALG